MNKAAYLLGYNHRAKLEKTAKIPGSWELNSKVFGNSIPGSIANIGTYMIPYYGDARMGYDALASYANMFGKNLSMKQRLGYGLTGTAEALFAAGGLAAGATTGPLGSTAVTGIGKPIVALISKLKQGPKILSALKKVKTGRQALRNSVYRVGTTKMGKPGKFLLGKNPYKGVPGKMNKLKSWGYGAGQYAPGMAGYAYGESLLNKEKEQEIEG